MLPHFQIGLWGTHAFIYFGLIYECPQKVETAHAFLEHINDLKQIFQMTSFGPLTILNQV